MNPLTTLFLGVLDVTWRASCLILLVYALRPLLRGRVPARLVFAAWIAVALRLLLPFALPAAWSPFNFASSWSRAGESAPPRLPTLTLLPAPTALAPAPSAAVPPTLWQRAAAVSPVSWLALGWAGGVATLATARLAAWLRFTRRLRRDRAARPGLFEATESGRIELIVTDAVRAPAVQGLFQPRLLFPRAFVEGLTPEEFRHTVAHELAHARRRDLLVQALLQGAAILHWFNPLAWLAVRTARHDCELACDESVLRRLPGAEHASYGATLLKIVSLAHGGLTPPRFGLGVVETKQHLKRRIEMIIAHPSSTPARTLLGAALLVALTLASLTRELPAQPPTVTPASTAVPAAGPRPAIQRLEGAPAPSSTPAVESMITVAPAPFGQAGPSDRLDALYPTGTIATIGGRIISVADVRRELMPLLSALKMTTPNAAAYDQKLIRLQDQIIKDLIDRAMIIQEFRRVPPGGEVRQVSTSVVDDQIADVLSKQFDNDRAKFLAYLRERGMSLNEYRASVEEEIIYRYAKVQEHNAVTAEKAAAAAAAKAADRTGKVHLRLIQLTRASGETDHGLRLRAKVVLDRFQAGETFEALAREFSQDSRGKRGGDWGWLAPSDIKAVFSDSIFALKAGEVGAPVILPEGCFLFYVEERK